MYVAELKRRRYRGRRPPEVTTPQQAFAILKPRIEDWSREHFLAILLDARNGVPSAQRFIASVNALAAKAAGCAIAGLDPKRLVVSSQLIVIPDFVPGTSLLLQRRRGLAQERPCTGEPMQRHFTPST